VPSRRFSLTNINCQWSRRTARRGTPRIWVAEVTNGTDIAVKASYLPTWFARYVLALIRISQPNLTN